MRFMGGGGVSCSIHGEFCGVGAQGLVGTVLSNLQKGCMLWWRIYAAFLGCVRVVWFGLGLDGVTLESRRWG